MKQLLALFFARNKEYYRDKGSLTWSFIMPPLIIAVVSLAFSGGEKPLFKVGYFPANAELPSNFQQVDYIQPVAVDNIDAAITKIRHHQIDILLDLSGEERYWINPQSQRGDVLQQLLNRETLTASLASSSWQATPIEGREVRYIDWAIPGILSMNLMFSGLFGVGYVIVRYRKNGVLKRLQAAPVSPTSFLGAQILSRLVIMLMVSILVYLASDFFLNFLMLGSYLNLLLVAILGNICILALGLIIASRLASEELANGLLNFLTFPMLLLSEVWFSLDGAPAWMVATSEFLPLTHMVQAARAIMLEGAGLGAISHHLFILTAMSLVFLAISAKLFKWKTD